MLGFIGPVLLALLQSPVREQHSTGKSFGFLSKKTKLELAVDSTDQICIYICILVSGCVKTDFTAGFLDSKNEVVEFLPPNILYIT